MLTVTPSHEPLFRQYAVCVLLPTYNNAGTLASVLEHVLAFTAQVIVVNDGSTDATEAVLHQFPDVKSVVYKPNRGKGHALREGFRIAWERGFRFAITMDSDGQHDAADLPAFLEALQADPGAFIIGARNLRQEHVPGKSSFGNRFSNFWFWVTTGRKLPDTQSGFRLYPLAPLQGMHFFSSKYEFEIEVPVRLSWKGVPIKSIPVSVYYPPAGERVSHFRPFRDFARISVLNTFLTLIALLWVHPLVFFRKLRDREGRIEIWNRLFMAPEESNLKKASSIGFGVFMGIFPVWGFQLAIGIPLAVYFRLNKPLFLLAANISIFPITPFIWALSLLTGKIILGYTDWAVAWQHTNLHYFKEAGLAFFLGGAALAVAAGGAAFFLSWAALQKWRRKYAG